jgi:hypothetical protein
MAVRQRSPSRVKGNIRGQWPMNNGSTDGQGAEIRSAYIYRQQSVTPFQIDSGDFKV